MRPPWVERVAQVVADEVAGDDEQQGERRGEDDQSGRGVEELLSRLDHVSPVGLRRLDPQAEIGQARRETGRDRECHDDLGEHRSCDVRQQFPREDARGAGAAEPAGDDVVAGRLACRQRAGQPGQAGREGDADAEDQADRAGTGHRHQEDDEQDGREGEGEIHQAHKDLFDDAAGVPGDEPDPGARDGGQRGRREGHEQQRAGAVH